MKKVNLFLCGSIKCGTTTLNDLLINHQQICGPTNVKEPRFFNINSAPNNDKTFRKDKNYHYYKFNNLDEYHKLYSLNDQSYQYFLDSSPTYFGETESHLKIKLYNPEAKFIICYRDPIERAYSHYLMEYHVTGYEKEKSFLRAINEEIRFVSDKFSEKKYIQNSLFGENLKSMLNLFERSQFYFVDVTDLKDDCQKVYDNICSWLSIDTPNSIQPLSKNEQLVYKTNYVTKILNNDIYQDFKHLINPKIKRFLKNIFLGKKLDLDIDHRNQLNSLFEKDFKNFKVLICDE